MSETFVDKAMYENSHLRRQLEACGIVAENYERGVARLQHFEFGEEFKKVAICRQSLDAAIARYTEAEATIARQKEEFNTLATERSASAQALASANAVVAAAGEYILRLRQILWAGNKDVREGAAAEVNGFGQKYYAALASLSPLAGGEKEG